MVVRPLGASESSDQVRTLRADTCRFVKLHGKHTYIWYLGGGAEAGVGGETRGNGEAGHPDEVPRDVRVRASVGVARLGVLVLG